MTLLFQLRRFDDRKPGYVGIQLEMMRCQVFCWMLRLQHGLVRGVVYEKLAGDALRQWQLLSECASKPFTN